MTGELAEVNEVFEPGDQFSFEKEMFRTTEDRNVKKLLAFHDRLEELMNSLANINNITEDELEAEGEQED
ncbi:hypothetical protein [Longispora fulva]|uniref:hypothetical protein n=2 Tax=Bacteria TaxID=2 RepID=UPI00362D73AE